LNFPSSNNATLLSGQRFMYISPDGAFVFGGSPTSWDFFVGVRVDAGAPNLSGQFYQAGIDEDDSNLGSGFGVLDSYFGSLGAANGTILGHQRLSSVAFASYDFTSTETYSVKSDGTYSTPFMRYVVGAGGNIRIGSGIGPFLGINVALAAPALN